MQALLETAAAMARDQHAAGRMLPRLVDLALFMRDFEREVRAPYLPAALVRPVMRGLARNAVDGVSFDVPEGQLFCLLGPNGAGKSTTTSILTTTLSPTSGRARIAGRDVIAEQAAVRREVGIVFQQTALDLNLTAEENLRLHVMLYGLYSWRPSYRLMPAAYRRQVQELAAALGIDDALDHRTRTLSGGMRRKLEIVRALLHRSRVLFLDEPTTGLDPQSRHSLWRYVQQMRGQYGTTVFLTTHYLEEAEAADMVCVLVAELTRLQIVQPTLEDTYLSILDRARRDGTGG